MCHARVLDAELFQQEAVLLPETVGFLLQTDAGVPAIGGPAAGDGQGGVGQGDGVHDGGANPPRPAVRQATMPWIGIG